MPESYGWDTIEAAEELYILDGQTFEQVAQRTGVSLSQLKRWSGDAVPTWPERRHEYRQAQTTVRRTVMLAKARLIESVLESEDPQKAYAFASLVSSARVIEADAQARQPQTNHPLTPSSESRKLAYLTTGGGTTEGGGADGIPPLALMAKDIRTPQDAVAALQVAVQAKINSMLACPGELSFAAIKDTKATMEMIEQLQAKYAPAEQKTEKPGGLSDEAAEAIRRQILGLSR